MGWSAWEVFRCTTCEQDPENCLSERLIQQTTDAMVAGGFRDAGYKIVWIDDCWQLKQRSASGALVPDPARWPHGLKAVADYVHSKGMLLGLCEPPATDALQGSLPPHLTPALLPADGDIGTKTCEGFPGLQYDPAAGGARHTAEQDAKQMAEWGIDAFKVQ